MEGQLSEAQSTTSVGAPVSSVVSEPLSPIPLKENPTSSMSFDLGIYDGPLELLLDLIKKNEMDICDIEVAEITRQYLAYLEGMKSLNLEVAGEFIVLAATLIHIKSKMLLPVEEEGSEEDDGLDPRDELVRKLLEYQAFKAAAKELGLLEGERAKMFTRQINDYYLSDLDPDDSEIDNFSANFYDLLAAFQGVLTKHGREAMHEVYEESVSIEEKTEFIRGLLANKSEINFFDLFREKWTRNELIATFLAILEIVKSRFAIVKQDAQYGDIMLKKRDQPMGVTYA